VFDFVSRLYPGLEPTTVEPLMGLHSNSKLALPANIRLWWKWMALENIVAHCDTSTITAAKSFIVPASGFILLTSESKTDQKWWKTVINHLSLLPWIQIRRHDTQHNDTQHNDKLYATLSITSLGVIFYWICVTIDQNTAKAFLGKKHLVNIDLCRFLMSFLQASCNFLAKFL
jgi:hypothetical protein